MNGKNSEFAQREILPEKVARKILSAAGTKKIRTLYNIIFPLMMVAAAALLAWAGITNRTAMDEADPAKSTFAIVLLSLGIVIFAALLTIRLLVGTSNQWRRRIAGNEIRRRPNKFVNPDAAGARFVEIIPRANWNNPTLLENATDVGFLAVDLERHCLLFEGDNARYWIPADAIVKCEQDSYTRLVQSPYAPTPSNKIITYHLVVVTVKISEDTNLEVPFCLRETPSLWSDEKAGNANYEFFRAIRALKTTVGTVKQ